MAATLTAAQLQDLSSGNAGIKLIPKIASDHKLTAADFASADVIYTTNGSLAIVEAEPTKTTIKIDQGAKTIKNVYETGDTTIKGSIPSQAIALYDYIYAKLNSSELQFDGSTIIIDGTQYKLGGGYSLDKKIVELTMLIESESKNTAVIFTNVEFYAVMDNKTVNTALSSFNFTATAIGGKFIVLKNGVPTT